MKTDMDNMDKKRKILVQSHSGNLNYEYRKKELQKCNYFQVYRLDSLHKIYDNYL